MVFTLFVGLNPSIPKAVETETCCLDKCFSQAYLEMLTLLLLGCQYGSTLSIHWCIKYTLKGTQGL